VHEVAVYGAGDPHWGEVVAAAVVLAPGRCVTEDELLATCAELGRYKTPKRLEFVDSLPRNTSGKVLRRTLRERADSTVDS
jgi:fatty-acyl-CoA synthase